MGRTDENSRLLGTSSHSWSTSKRSLFRSSSSKVHEALRENNPKAPATHPALPKKAPPTTGRGMPAGFYRFEEPLRIGTEQVGASSSLSSSSRFKVCMTGSTGGDDVGSGIGDGICVVVGTISPEGGNIPPVHQDGQKIQVWKSDVEKREVYLTAEKTSRPWKKDREWPFSRVRSQMVDTIMDYIIDLVAGSPTRNRTANRPQAQPQLPAASPTTPSSTYRSPSSTSPRTSSTSYIEASSTSTSSAGSSQQAGSL